MNAVGKTRRARWRRWAVTSSLTLAVCLYLARNSLLASAGVWLVTDDRMTEPVDCAIVLGGAAETRPFFAASLYQAGWCHRVAYLETVDSPATRDGLVPTHGTLMRAVFADCGIPDQSVVRLSGVVNSTRDEFERIAEFVDRTDTGICAVITSDFHTRRCQRVRDRVLGQNRHRVLILGVPTDGFGPENWWQFRGGVHRYAAEFIKLGRDLLR